MRTIAAILFLAVLALPFLLRTPSTGGRAETPAGPVERLLILSPHRREVRQAYSAGFGDWMARHEGRQVELVWLDVGGTSKILKDLESRFAANPRSAGVDLLFGGGVDPYIQARELDWLAPCPLPPGTLEGIPPTCAGTPVYDPEGYWYGVALSGFGIVYNRVLLQRTGLPEPATWEDLAQPAFFSWVGSGDPRSSGSVHMCFEIVLQARGFEAGWNLLTRLCANVRRFGEGAGTVPREVAAGEVAAGMVIDQYARTVMDAAGRDVIGFTLPRGETLIGADGVALLRGAPSPELAARFIAYTLSPEGQRLLYAPPGREGHLHALHRLPVRRDAYDGPDAPATRPYDYAAGFTHDPRRAGARWRLLNDLIGVWLIDAHTELAAAWQAGIRRGTAGETARRLGAPPLPEAELDALVPLWDDSRVRAATVTRWAREARARYRQEQQGD